ALEIRTGIRDNDCYFSFAEPFLSSGQRIVCFADPRHRPEILARAGRHKDRVTVVDFGASDLAYNRPWFFSCDLPSKRNLPKDTHWYLAVNHQKAIWMKAAADIMPRQRYFCWIDFGINHMAKLDASTFEKLLPQFRHPQRGMLIVPVLRPLYAAASEEQAY